MDLKTLLGCKLISSNNAIELRDFDHPMRRNGEGFRTIRIKQINSIYREENKQDISNLLNMRVAHIYTELHPTADNPIIIQLTRND